MYSDLIVYKEGIRTVKDVLIITGSAAGDWTH